MKLKGSLSVVLLSLILVVSGEEAAKENNAEPSKEPGEKEERLGLLAPTLGKPPVPGYDGSSTGQALISPVPGGPGHYDAEPIPVIGDGYQGGHGGPGGACQCVPVEHCTQGGGGDPYQPPPPPPPHDKLPVIDEPGYPPVVDPNPPPPPYGDDETGGTNPVKDGAGSIDIRIVNKPPGPGGVQCLPGHVFCCGNQISVPPPGPQGGDDHFPGGGYTGCGTRNFLDVPGYEKLEYGQAKFGAYPWMAVILGKGNNYIGAGVLLNAHYVLTAAHKVQAWKPGTYMKVRLGEWNAKDDDEPYKNVEIDVEDIRIHPQFNPENLYNDVAIIRLAKPIDINAFPHIRSACLPKEYSNYVGQRCWVPGFGKDAFGTGKHSYIMREVDVPVVESNTCESLLRATRLGKYFELNRASFICAGGEEGKDSCTGDGGSPLMCESNGVWNVVGLVAWGIGCADYAVPGVYVNVQNYIPWIEHNMQSLSQIAQPSPTY